jgi:hypothetical protein
VYGSDWSALAQTVAALLAHERPPRVILAIPHRHPTGPLAQLATAKGLRATTLVVERAPEHGAGRAAGEQPTPVSVIEVRRAAGR